MKPNNKRNIQQFAGSSLKRGRTINPAKKAEALENIKKEKKNEKKE
jgi:hypothetical protein